MSLWLPVLPLFAVCCSQSLYIHPEIQQLLSSFSLQKLLELIQVGSIAMAADTMATNIKDILLVCAPTAHLPILLQTFCLFFESTQPLVFLNFLFLPLRSVCVHIGRMPANFTFTGSVCENESAISCCNCTCFLDCFQKFK